MKDVAIDGVPFEDGIASGMAPGAKVAAYKVCWEGAKGIQPGCFNSDSVAAINDAVLDGVDVLNYSIGGTSESDALDAVAQAFRGASNAGIYVANSAGNNGPGVSTLDHPAPWVTTVAAATVRRSFQAVELGNGARYVGASTTPPLETPTSLVTSVSVKLAAASDADAKLCAPGTLDPASAAGKIVQCDRGVVDRIAKSFEVQRAGGVGMVMTNTSPNSLNGDYHPIPSVHVDEIARKAILDYLAAAGAGATAKIVPLTAAELAAAPQVPEIAAFSSAWPVDHHRRRHPEARHRRSRRRHPGRRGPAVPLRPRLGPHLGHVDGLAAHRRSGRAPQGRSSHVAAVGDQVGAHDDDPGHGVQRQRSRSPRAQVS